VRAAKLYGKSLSSWWGQDNELGTVEVLTGLARLVVEERPEAAVRLFAAAEAVQTLVGLAVAPALCTKNERALAAARAALGEEAFATAWAAGKNLPLKQAVAEAQTVTDDAGRAAPADPDPSPSYAAGGLSPRELEVLKLVAGGLTNAQVAERLFLSPPHRKCPPQLYLPQAGSKLAQRGDALRRRARPGLTLSSPASSHPYLDT
jgi:Bacterial regulatory proteins, luxR family